MKITASLIDKLLRLRNGESIPASLLRGEWVEELERDGVIVSTSRGSRRTIFAPQPEAFLHALSAFDERLADLDLMRDTLQTNEMPRSVQASATGNSKLLIVRSCPGFPVNSYEPIECWLNGEPFTVNPKEGSFLFVADWNTFMIPQNVIVVGIENMENFRKIRQQRKLFETELGRHQFLFVSRYPQSTDLRSWLIRLCNRYVHFGDFDLAGINIFLTEFYRFLGDRSTYLIPSDIGLRLANGSTTRYNEQYEKFHNICCDNRKIQLLIDLINKYHKGYDQEGYIE